MLPRMDKCGYKCKLVEKRRNHCIATFTTCTSLDSSLVNKLSWLHFGFHHQPGVLGKELFKEAETPLT